MFLYFSIDSPVLHGARRLLLHNTFLTSLVENGIVGFTLFIMLIVKAAMNYFNVIRSETETSALRVLAISWQAILLFILFNGIKANWNENKLLWFCFAISMIVGTIQKKSALEEQTVESGSTTHLFAKRVA
jgi:O-antigen ligase